MNPLSARLAKSPKASLVAGKAIFLVGAVLVLAAIFGRVGMSAANAQRATAKLPSATALAEVYPQHPTWIVPEGPVGFILAALLVLLGMYLTVVASDAIKARGLRR